MNQRPNILFIMCDQLRWDYLSCYGHPHLKTPNIDRLAARGVRFDRAYVQSPTCGPARAAIYTGRYVSSHGASINFAPLPIGEQFLGDYLEPLGVRTALVGKTHIIPNTEGMERLGIDPQSKAGQRLAQGAFEPYWRDDGLHPNDTRSRDTTYNQYLREQGYSGENPWQTHANGTIDENGDFLSGWFLEAAPYPANIREEHSETAYTTTRAMEFIGEASQNEQPWCLHLSYIKPHWPYIAPAPYHNMYSSEHVLPANRHEGERAGPHPVYEAYMEHQSSLGFVPEETRQAVIPTYMGLIKQIDDQIGCLLGFLEERGELENTFIIFTSDHGDYLGDHWLGEKSFFHEESVRVPLIVVDPRSAADVTRGTVNNQLVESIDFVPTFIEVMGGVPSYRLEGRSILPLLHQDSQSNAPHEWRDFVVSELDMSDRGARQSLNLPFERCWSLMVRTEEWKYIVFDGFPPMLFALEEDPQEIVDVGRDPAYKSICDEMKERLLQWTLRRKIRADMSPDQVDRSTGGYNREKRGILLGYWSEDDLPDEVKLARS
ncbi:MAG: alkaline phosphatase family protein [Chloroflexota bacterium]